ncbi:hypothetical protein ACIBRY_18045 [Streptomyces anulatus]
MGLDRVDIVHVHDPDEHLDAALDEELPALADFRDQGVGAIGVGTNHVAPRDAGRRRGGRGRRDGGRPLDPARPDRPPAAGGVRRARQSAAVCVPPEKPGDEPRDATARTAGRGPCGPLRQSCVTSCGRRR